MTEIDVIETRLTNAVTEYDRKQASRRDYNPYALAQYLERVADIAADIRRGADPRQAIVAGFNGRLAAACLRALKLPAYTKADAMGGMVYSPVTPDPNAD